jgi:DNA excision repair protein ERCC-4
MTRASPVIVMPFTLVIDTREQAPYSFSGIRADADKQGRPVEVPVKFAALPAGDYSIEGYETKVAIERKSLADLYSTLGQGRERFEREHERLASCGFAAVVIEASWEEILRRPPPNSRLTPRTILRTSQSWAIKYGVHWVPAVDRRFAELWTFQTLRKFWEIQKPQRELI